MRTAGLLSSRERRSAWLSCLFVRDALPDETISNGAGVSFGMQVIDGVPKSPSEADASTRGLRPL